MIKNKKAQADGALAVILIGVFLVFLLVVFSFGYLLTYALISGEERITIDEKWVKYDGDDAKYLISSTNDQVFEITDTIIKWRFDSSNLYARLDTGQICNIKTQGWRFPFFSDYKNILEADCE